MRSLLLPVGLRSRSQISDARAGRRRINRKLRLKHVTETTQLLAVRIIGTPHAFKIVSSGGTDNVESRPSHIRYEYDNPVLARVESIGELQEAVSRYLPALYSRAYRYVSHAHDAEDAVQDALLSAYKHLDQFKATAKITTWLTTIVTNSALSQLRRRPRQPQVSLDEKSRGDQDYCLADKLTDARPSPEGECIRSEMRGNLMQSVMELSPLLRETIQLFYLDGLSTMEIAQTLGVPQGTVKARMSRGRSQLKRLMRAA
jgi:RNA polymerase sigma-70 factor, ECF subfamily